MTFSEEKWVRIMADYCSEGIWSEDGSEASIDELPVSGALKQRLLAWQHRYDTECEDYLPEGERKNFDVEQFAEEGRLIALAVKAELPEWTVIYYDESRQDQLDYQYEIR